MIRRAILFLLAVGGLAASAVARHDYDTKVHVVSTCRVTAFDDGPHGRWSAQRSRSILIEIGGRSVLVTPSPFMAQASALRGRRVDAVLLTSLDEDTLAAAFTEADDALLVGSRLIVDRTILDQAMSAAASHAAPHLQALVASGKLYAPEAHVDVLPGVRLTVSPLGRGVAGRVKVGCGNVTLLVLSGTELSRSGFDGAHAAPLDRRDPAHLRALAGDRAMLATFDGDYPALVSIYRLFEGFRLGSIEAREYAGTPGRARRVVEATASDTREPRPDGRTIGR